MIIFFFGSDTFRLKNKISEILNFYQKEKGGFNFSYINAIKDDFKKVKETNSQSSLFKDKKLILIENIFKNKEFKDAFLKEINLFLSTENIILISEDEKIKKNDSLFSFLIKNTKHQEFELLKPFQIKKWIEKKVKENGFSIEEEALNLLATSNDLWKINNEIKKLISFSDNKKITKKNVLILTNIETETDIFKTIEAISKKNKKQAISLLYNHLKKGESPLYLLSMISYQFKNLIILKELVDQNFSFHELIKKSQLHPFVIKKSLPLLNLFSFPELKNIYSKLFQIDTNIKIGKIEAEAGLEILIAEI